MTMPPTLIESIEVAECVKHLKCHACREYVPSQANGADFPSRLPSTEAARFYHVEGFQDCIPDASSLA